MDEVFVVTLASWATDFVDRAAKSALQQRQMKEEILLDMTYAKQKACHSVDLTENLFAKG